MPTRDKKGEERLFLKSGSLGTPDATTAINSEWKYQILAVVAHVPYTTQNLAISRCCFAEEGKGIQRFLTHVLSYCFAH